MMAFVVGDTLTLGAMVNGTFAGSVQWQVGERTLAFPFDTEAVRSGAIVTVSDDPNAKLEGQGASFRGTSWLNVDLPLADWGGNGSALQLTFTSKDAEVLTLPEVGYHYVMKLVSR